MAMTLKEAIWEAGHEDDGEAIYATLTDENENLTSEVKQYKALYESEKEYVEERDAEIDRLRKEIDKDRAALRKVASEIFVVLSDSDYIDVDALGAAAQKARRAGTRRTT